MVGNAHLILWILFMVRVRAPELPQNYTWLNTDKPLSLKKLKGRIVILDFWTYCCINCLHVLPDLKYLEQKYKDSLTVIGVHSAKFDNEKDIENIRQAILRYDIEHPVLVDKDFKVWQDYAARAYPSFMIIDPEGYVIATLMGENKRDVLDELIQELIKQHQDKGTINLQELNIILEKQRQPIVTPLAFPGKVLAAPSYLFIADTGHNRIIVTTLEGELLHIIGSGKSGLKDGNFDIVEFLAPQGMIFDYQNQILYVADTENHALRKIDLRRQIVETIAGTGTQSRNLQPTQGNALDTALNSPWDLVKHKNKLYIAMAGSHQIWMMDLETNIIKTYAGTGAEACFDGDLETSVFAQPSGITINSNYLYIADSESSSIRAINLETRKVTTICGSGDLYLFGDKDGIGEEVRLQHCMGVEYIQGNLWVADTYNHKIKLVNPKTGECKTVLSNGASNIKFSEPSGLSVIDTNLYIADINNHAIRHVNLNTLEVTTLKISDLCAPNFCIPSGI
jgi:thiol-disulfide isomerase/thioredoxin